MHFFTKYRRKKILLKYYSRRNFGDDLFVLLFTDRFQQYDVQVLGTPTYLPKGKHEVKLAPCSWIISIIGKLQAMFSKYNIILSLLKKLYHHTLSRAEVKYDACVLIGGSMFMDHKHTGDDRPISFFAPASIPRNMHIHSVYNSNSNQFVIGASLGPVYHEKYFGKMDSILSGYSHVCLRDYSSYLPFCNRPNIQYAPDVAFMLPEKQFEENGSLVISCMDLSLHTNNSVTINAYYKLLIDLIGYWQHTGKQVILLDLCVREGDSIASSKIVNTLPNKANVTCVSYSGNVDEIIEIIGHASYVIATRFHSMIVGLVYGKTLFPISYNCKTENYLQDLNYEGMYATLDTICTLSLEDILQNYRNQYVCDVTEHKKYAKNQFAILQRYLQDKE